MKTKTLTRFALSIGTCAAVLLGGYNNVHAQGLTDAQKEEINTIIKEYIASNPQDILDAVENYRMEQEKQIEKSAKDNLKTYEDFFKRDDITIGGNPDGDVTIVEFFDYNCGYCRKAFMDIRKLIEQDDNLRVVLLEMPILSPSSKKMAEIALAAHEQGKYFEMHTALMDYKGNQSEDAFLKLAEKLDLDIEKMKKDMQSEKIQAAIGKTAEMGRKLGVRGTPGFIIGDEIYPGYIGLQGLKNAVKEARKKNAG